MSENKSENNRSVSIDGNVSGSAVVIGDSNVVNVSYQKTTLPDPGSVIIKDELAALRAILAELQTSDADRRRIDRALNDAEAELKIPEAEQDRDLIGGAMERAIQYAEKAGGFAEKIEKLKPHIKNVVAWLGQNWHKLLPVVGLTV